MLSECLIKFQYHKFTWRSNINCSRIVY